MKKMNNILKMISQMESNANEIKLAKHEVQLSMKQISDFQKESDTLYKEMTSKGEQYKKEYYSKTAALEKPFNELRAELYRASIDFINRTKDLGLDGKSLEPYKKMEKLISDMDNRSDFFVKEYVKQ